MLLADSGDKITLDNEELTSEMTADNDELTDVNLSSGILVNGVMKNEVNKSKNGSKKSNESNSVPVVSAAGGDSEEK